MEYISPLLAIKRMRELTHAGVFFSFSYMSYNTTKGESSGVKIVTKGMLRRSYRANQSNYSNQLIAYVNLDNQQNRQFHLPLLLTFNQYTIKP